MRGKVAAIVAAAMAVQGCVVSDGGAPPLQLADQQQIVGALTNFSVVGSLASGQSYCEYHMPTGGLMGRGTTSYTGSWQVTGNQVCYKTPTSDQFGNCVGVVLAGQRATFYAADGTQVASGNLVGGNVC